MPRKINKQGVDGAPATATKLEFCSCLKPSRFGSRDNPKCLKCGGSVQVKSKHSASDIIVTPLGHSNSSDLVASARTSIEQVLARIKATEVNDSTLPSALDLLANLNQQVKASDALRKQLVKPIKDAAKHLDGLFNAFLNPARLAEDELRRKILEFRALSAKAAEASDEQRQRTLVELEEEVETRETMLQLAREAGDAKDVAEHEAALERLNQEIQSAATAITVAPPPKTMATNDASISARQVWDFEVEDASLLPPRFLTPDEKAIREAIRHGEREIPGVRIFRAETLAVSKKSC